MESSGFSTSSIPDSVFAIPADYKKDGAGESWGMRIFRPLT